MDAKIGLEIHCQLTGVKTKLFCTCLCDYRGRTPNSNICPICAGLPGTLPLLNRRAVEFAGMIAAALGCKVPGEIAFYRKNYFYPDLPKNFQLTQYNAYGLTSIGIDGSVRGRQGLAHTQGSARGGPRETRL
jgi:aspartyl-tRNA(Asn)/glutamyl-tRNA(Gln) amidotransferase subunit B